MNKKLFFITAITAAFCFNSAFSFRIPIFRAPTFNVDPVRCRLAATSSARLSGACAKQVFMPCRFRKTSDKIFDSLKKDCLFCPSACFDQELCYTNCCYKSGVASKFLPCGKCPLKIAIPSFFRGGLCGLFGCKIQRRRFIDQFIEVSTRRRLSCIIVRECYKFLKSKINT